ncbi:MAG: hypothetical protein R3C44_21035 [Chloroflexota bacterium]
MQLPRYTGQLFLFLGRTGQKDMIVPMTAGSDSTQRPRQTALRVAVFLSALGVLIVGGAFYALHICPLSDLCGPITATDISQARLDTALPAPQGNFAVEQTFVPDHNGLSAVEFILVGYDDGQPDGHLTVELWDDGNQLVAGENLRSAELTHNQTYALDFPPQPGSAGRPYRIRLTGNAQNHASVWGYSLDVIQPGDLQLLPLGDAPLSVETAALEMRFVSRYQLTMTGALASLADTLLRYGGLFLLAVAFLLMPGCLLLLIGRQRHWDAAAWLGAALALGLAVWPLAWLWLTLLGGRWSGTLLWITLIVGWGIVALLWVRRTRQTAAGESQFSLGIRLSREDWLAYGLLAILLVISVAVRLLAVRDLAFPPWVDSSRHGLITAVMVEQGQAPGDYSPFLPVGRFPYHYGFHTVPASLGMMTGLPLAGLLLMLGQLLNGLLPLTVYSAGWMVSRQRAVGLLAAFLVALPFYFPGYYATWGRMTQLAAMVILPVLLALTWRMGRGWPDVWALTAVLGAGVFMVHFRVFLFFLPFALLVLLIQLVSYRRFRSYALAALLGAALIAPRAYQLWRDANPGQALQNSVAGFNDFPTGYLTAGWERGFVVLAAIGLVVVFIAMWRGRRWSVLPLLLIAWVTILFFLLAGERLGLPETLVVNLNSMYISLFLPLSLFLSVVAWHVLRWGSKALRRRGWRDAVELATVLLLGLTIGVLSLFGIRIQIQIINPQTILAEQQDLDGLDWVAQNVDSDATFAVNSWRWLGNTWAASDGGAWLVPTTGRMTTTPPIDHIYNPELFTSVRAFNEYASVVHDWSDPVTAEWLRSQDVTHVFVGARGGFFDPAALSHNPLMQLIYQSEGVFVFALSEP